jgi:hypothetical protein
LSLKPSSSIGWLDCLFPFGNIAKFPRDDHRHHIPLEQTTFAIVPCESDLLWSDVIQVTESRCGTLHYQECQQSDALQKPEAA